MPFARPSRFACLALVLAGLAPLARAGALLREAISRWLDERDNEWSDFQRVEPHPDRRDAPK